MLGHGRVHAGSSAAGALLTAPAWPPSRPIQSNQPNRPEAKPEADDIQYLGSALPMNPFTFIGRGSTRSVSTRQTKTLHMWISQGLPCGTPSSVGIMPNALGWFTLHLLRLKPPLNPSTYFRQNPALDSARQISISASDHVFTRIVYLCSTFLGCC